VPTPHVAEAVAAEPTTLRLWMTNIHAGTIIGKGGSKVKKVREQSGCKVTIAELGPGEAERLVSIAGSPTAVNVATQLIVDLLEVSDAALQADPLASLDAPPHAYKLLLTNNQVGGIIGKGGRTISQMREQSGASIKAETPMPLSTERVVSVTGAKTQVVVALSLIVAKLAQMPDDSPPPHQRQRTGPPAIVAGVMGAPRYGAQQQWAAAGGAVAPAYPGGGFAAAASAYPAFGSQYGAPGALPQGYASQPGAQASAAPSGYGAPSYAPQPYAPQQGYGQSFAQPQQYGQAQGFAPPSYGGFSAEAPIPNYGASSAGTPASGSVTATAGGAEQLVPVTLVGRLIGRGGAGIKEMREQSRAMIKIESECVPGTELRKVIITGTPDQTQVAVAMIQTRLAMGP